MAQITRYRVTSAAGTVLADGFATRQAADGWAENFGAGTDDVERYAPEYEVRAVSGTSDLGRSYGPASLGDCAGYLAAPSDADRAHVAAAHYQLAVRRVDLDGLAELDEDEQEALHEAYALALAEADDDEGDPRPESQCGICGLAECGDAAECEAVAEERRREPIVLAPVPSPGPEPDRPPVVVTTAPDRRPRW